MNNKIVIVTGEVSGDTHAAHLVKHIKSKNPDMRIYAVGGENLKSAGAEIIQDIKELSIVGVFEVLRNYKKIKAVFDKVLSFIIEQKPQAVIFVDYPGFNLRLAEKVHKLGIKTIYYISPQIWAWGKRRIKKIKNIIDHMIVLFDFEYDLYNKANVNVFFSGHPLVDSAKPSAPKEDLKQKFKLDPNKKTIGLFPGSRLSEVKKLLPEMIKTANILNKHYPEKLQFIIKKSPIIDTHIYESFIKQNSFIELLEGSIYDALSISDFAVVCSGTATLETAIIGTPMIIVYIVPKISWALFRKFVKIDSIGLCNIAAGRQIAPERLQDQAKGENLAEEVIDFLENPEKIQHMKSDLSKIKTHLGSPGASKRAAEYILTILPK